MWGNIILHKCTINGNYMMCGSWDMKCNRHTFFVILGHFCPFTQNIKILKKWKKHLMVLSFYTSVPKTMIIVYTACYTILCYTMLYCFLSFYPPNSPKNQNFKKMKNMLGDIIILCMCAKNMIRMMYISWDMVHSGRMDRQTDKRTEKVIYRGGYPT